MDVLSSSEGTEFFDIPVRFMNSVSSPSLETVDALRNENGELQPVSNLYLEIGTIPLEESSNLKQPLARNQFEINSDDTDKIIYDNINNKINPQTFVTNPQETSDISSNEAQWFEEDVDLTKIFLGNTEGALDEFNLGFSENILFGSVDDPQHLTKENKASEDDTDVVEQNVCFELNNNINCDNNISSSIYPSHDNTEGSNIVSNDGANEKLSTSPSILDKRLESKRDNTSCSTKSPFNCQFCSKSFRYSSRLKRHLTTHQNKQYPCRICHKLFSRVDVMEVHIARTHFKTHQQNNKTAKVSDNESKIQIKSHVFIIIAD